MGGKISWLLERSPLSEIHKTQEVSDLLKLRTKVQHGKSWKGPGNSIVEFSSHCGGAVCMSPTCSSLDGVLVNSSSAAALPVMRTLASVVVLWLYRYGSFLSQILRILVLCFLNCKLPSRSCVQRPPQSPLWR